MKSVTIYSCSYGAFPPPPEPLQPDPDCKYVYFTDRGSCMKKGSVWTPKYFPIYGTSIRRASRYAKILPDNFFSTDWTIYVDSGLVLKESPATLIDEVDTCDLGVHVHSRRKFIHQEGERIGEVFPNLKDRAIHHVKEMGPYPRVRLAECGLLVRRNTMRMLAMNHIWWGLFCLGPERDQLSFPVAAAMSKVNIKWFDGEISHSRRTCVRKDEAFTAMKELQKKG